ncbi:hypothetical protein NDU88_006512 [Pleurodeles waltl]|uniref:Uncharacterized protein n=1 Tax=Pleurodeles waltl TaxID=8319 RepID=A0AAV7X1R9_PLEWA|nr:hypothetical protein NDU88_006512 [Pleurodeles waltl]
MASPCCSPAPGLGCPRSPGAMFSPARTSQRSRRLLAATSSVACQETGPSLFWAHLWASAALGPPSPAPPALGTQALPGMLLPSSCPGSSTVTCCTNEATSRRQARALFRVPAALVHRDSPHPQLATVPPLSADGLSGLPPSLIVSPTRVGW